MKTLGFFPLLFFFLLTGLGGSALDHKSSKGETPEKDYKNLRKRMVQQQIRSRGIRDAKVLEAMSSVPRHLFVPEAFSYLAYNDGPLPIGKGQTISQPYIVAFMTEALGLSPTDKVLEVGTGSGYQAAILAEIVKQVYSIEIIPELGDEAGKRLARMGYKNIEVRIGDGYLGWPEHAPFDAIMVTAAAEMIPPPLVEQLKVGGKLCIPVGDPGSIQYLKLITKEKHGLQKETLLTVRFVPLVHPE